MGTAERVECLRDLSPAVYKTFELYGNKKRAVDLIFRNLRLFYLLFMTIECSRSVHSIVFLQHQLLFPAFFSMKIFLVIKL